MRQRSGHRELEIQEIHANSLHTLKLKLSSIIVDEGIFLYTNTSREVDSYLARLLFEIGGIECVIITKDTITLKLADLDKFAVLEPIKDAIREYFYSEKPAIENPRSYSYPKATGIQQREREREARRQLSCNSEIKVIAVKGNTLFIQNINSWEGISQEEKVRLLEYLKGKMPWLEEIQHLVAEAEY